MQWRCPLPVVLLTLTLISRSAPAADPPAAPDPTDRREAFPVFGVSIVPPTDWAPLPLGEMGHVARWAKPNPKGGRWLAVVNVEAEPLEDPPQDFAKDMAARMGGTVAGEPLDLDGVPAASISGANKSLVGGLSASSAVVAVRGRYGYVIAGMDSPGHPAGGAVEDVRASWKWIDLEPPARHLETLGDPVLVLGLFEMRVPTVMRRFPVKDERIEAHFGLYNLVTGVQEMSLGVTLLPTRGNMEEVRSMTGRSMFKMFNLARPPAWALVPGKPRRWVSSDYQYMAKDERGRPVPSVARHAMVELSDKEAALLNFMFGPASDEDRAAYDAAIATIVRSIQSPSAATRRGAQAAPALGRLPWSPPTKGPPGKAPAKAPPVR